MNVDQRILNKFETLINDGENLLETRVITQEEAANYGESASGRLDSDLAIQWEIRILHLLKQLCSENHTYYSILKSLCNTSFSSQPYLAEKSLAILKAAKEDYETGDLIEFRDLIEAEVFNDFLEQAEHLLNQGYFTASAVIAGSVLEDALRKLCVKNGITLSAKPKLDSMNSELAKIGVYNLLKQKQITALADLRNKAAHGKWKEFNEKDVEDMIRNVRRFMEDYFS